MCSFEVQLWLVFLAPVLCVELCSVYFCSCDDCLMYQLFRHPAPWCELDSLVIFPLYWDSHSFPWKPEKLEE